MRKMIATILLLLLALLPCRAQTNVIFGYMADLQMTPMAGTAVTMSLISPNPKLQNGIWVSPQPVTHYTDANGFYSFNNVSWGEYEWDIAGQALVGYVGINTTGSNNVIMLTTNTYAFVVNGNAYSVAAGTGVTILTNGSTLTISSSTNYDPLGAAQAATNGLPASALPSYVVTNGSAPTLGGLTVTNNSNVANITLIGSAGTGGVTRTIQDEPGGMVIESVQLASGAVSAATFNGSGSGLTGVTSNSIVSINPSQIYPAITGGNYSTNSYATNAGFALTAATATNLAAALPLTNTSGTLPASALPAIVVTNVTVESFGGLGDGNVAYDFSTTNGSTTVYSSSANFTAGDVGKWICVYYNAAGTNWVDTLITNYLSATQVQVSNAPTATVTGMMGRWGHDNSGAIMSGTDYFLTNNVSGTLVFGNATYFINPTSFTYCGTNTIGTYNQGIWSAVPIGYSSRLVWHAWQGFTNSIINVTLQGCAPAVQSVNGGNSLIRNATPGEGTVIFCPMIGTHKGNDYIFSMSCTNGYFATFNTYWKNLHLLRPGWATIGDIDNSLGGAITVDNCSLVPDYFSIASWFNVALNTNSSTNVYDIHLADTSNGGNQYIKDSEMNGGSYGVYCSDHAFISNTRIICLSGSGLVVDHNTDAFLQGVTFDGNATNIMLGFNSTYASLFGDCSFGTDDVNIYHNSIYEDAAGQNGCDLTVKIDDARYANITTSAGPFQNAPLGIDVRWTSSGQYSAANSNYYGATLTRTHYPYGVQFPGVNVNGNYTNSMDWSALGTYYFGFPNVSAFGIYNCIGYNSLYKQWYWNEAIGVSGETLNFSPNGGSPSLTIGFDTGNITSLGTYYGNGSGLTNANAGALFGSGTVPPSYITNASGFWSAAPSGASGGNVFSNTVPTFTSVIATAQIFVTNTTGQTVIFTNGTITASTIQASNIVSLNGGTFTGNGSGLTNTPSTLAAPVPTNSQPTVLASAILTADGGRAMIWTNSGHYSDSLFAVQLVIGGTTPAMTNLFSATWGTPVTPGYQPYILIGNENDTNSTQATAGPELHIPFSLITTNGFQVWSGFAGPTINTTNYYVFLRFISQ